MRTPFAPSRTAVPTALLAAALPAVLLVPAAATAAPAPAAEPVAAASAAPAPAPAADTPVLKGAVGPGFTISVSKATVKAGTYRIVVRDRSAMHNWRIKGPGVNKATTVGYVGKKAWTVKLKRGTYTIVCDPHPSSMVTKLVVK